MDQIQAILDIHNSIFKAFPKADTINEDNINWPELHGYYNLPEYFDLQCNNGSSRIELNTETFQEITGVSIQQYHDLTEIFNPYPY